MDDKVYTCHLFRMRQKFDTVKFGYMSMGMEMECFHNNEYEIAKYVSIPP